MNGTDDRGSPGDPADDPAPDVPRPAPDPAHAVSGPPRATADRPRTGCQLPPVVPDFTGRKAECTQLASLLAPEQQAVAGPHAVAGPQAGGGQDAGRGPVVVVSGPPGAGKSTLALRVAHALRESFPDGQLYLQLGGGTHQPREAREVLGEALRALGVGSARIPESTGERAELYRSQLAGRRVLVVADDAGSAEQVEPLRPAAPGCALLITSRSRLAGPDGATLAALESLRRAEAVELLARIAGPDRVTAEPQAADRLVASCGLLPLAVRIAGAKLAANPGWPVERVAGLIADERRRLDELSVGDLAVRASVAPSYEALDERARRAFRRLSLLNPVDVPPWVVAALLDEQDAAGPVRALVDRSLLTPAGTDATGAPRYRLHNLLRDFAAERMAEEPAADRDVPLDRVLAGYLELAVLADQRLPRLGFFPPSSPPPAAPPAAAAAAAPLTTDAVAWFTAERLNLLAIIRWACAHGRYPLAARLASCHPTFHFLQHRVDDAERMWRVIEQAAEQAGDIATSSEARFHLAWMMADRGRFADAYTGLEKCVPILAARGVNGALAVALYWRAFCADMLGYHEAQRYDAEQCLGLARRLKEPGIEVVALRVLGLALTRLGSFERGVALCEQAVGLARAQQELAWEYHALAGLAYSLFLAGRYEQAERCCREGIEVSERLGLFVTGQAFLLGMLGDSYTGQRRYAEGIEALSSALAAFEEHGDRRGQALCLLKIGRAYLALGQTEPAREHLQRAFPIFGELGLTAHEDMTVRALSECRPLPV